MERALVGLLGAGLATLATGLGLRVPPGASVGGYEFASHLLISHPGLGGPVRDMLRGVRSDWSAAGWSDDVVGAHVAVLARLLEAHAPPEPLVTEAFALAQSQDLPSAGPRTDMARRIADAVVARAHAAHELPMSGFDDHVARFLLERLFARLLAAPEMLIQIRPSLEEFLARAGLPDERVPSTPLVDPDAVSASQINLPPAALAALRADLACRAGGQDLDAAVLAMHGRMLEALIHRISAPSAAGEDGSYPRAMAAAALSEGRFSQADEALSAAEDLELRAAQQALVDAARHLSAAAELRIARADLAEARADLRRAARHVAAAVRCMPQAIRIDRWRLLIRQATLLLRLETESHDRNVLSEAATTLAQAAAAAGRSEHPSEWAIASNERAGLLLRLGESGRPDLVRTAIDELDSVLDVIARHGAADAWGETQIRRGAALAMLANLGAESAGLEHAAHAFRSALRVLSPERTPHACVEAHGRLGQVLKALGEATQGQAHLAEAVVHLEAALDTPVSSSVFPSGGRSDPRLILAGAIRALSAASRDPELLSVAVAAYRRALGESAGHEDTSWHAEVHDGLGHCLWQLGAHRGDCALLTDAAAAKLEALTILEDRGPSAWADALRGELQQLHDILAPLVGDGPGSQAPSATGKAPEADG